MVLLPLMEPITRAKLAVFLVRIYALFFARENATEYASNFNQYSIHGTAATANDVRFFGLDYNRQSGYWQVTVASTN